MTKLTCTCGYVAEDRDHYVVEARMWKHAQAEHAQMLSDMNETQIADWLREADKTMGV